MNESVEQNRSLALRRQLQTIVFDQCFSPCGKYLGVCDNFGFVSLFNLGNALCPETTDDSYKPFFTFKAHDTPIYTITSTDRLLITAATGEIVAWSWAELYTKAPKIIWKWNLPQNETEQIKGDQFGTPEINSVAMLKDNNGVSNLLFAGCGDNKVHVWDMSTGSHLYSLRGHKDYVHCVTLRSNGKECLSASEDGSVRLWDIRCPGEAVHIIEPYKHEKCCRAYLGRWISTVAVDKADDWMVCGGGPKLCLWHLRSMAATTVFDTAHTIANDAMFCEDSVISAGNSPYVQHWSVNGDQRAKVPCSPNCVLSVAINNKSDSAKVLSIAGGSPKIDICTNFGYKAFSLTVC